MERILRACADNQPLALLVHAIHEMSLVAFLLFFLSLRDRGLTARFFVHKSPLRHSTHEAIQLLYTECIECGTEIDDNIFCHRRCCPQCWISRKRECVSIWWVVMVANRQTSGVNSCGTQLLRSTTFSLDSKGLSSAARTQGSLTQENMDSWVE